MRTWNLRREATAAAVSAVVAAKREQIGEGHLIVVNAKHPVGRPVRHLSGVPDDLLRPSRSEEPFMRLERTCLSLLRALLDACCGKESIAVVSGYRSRETQERLYAESVRENGADFTAKYVALPGASEHQTGLAVDVGLYGDDVDYIRPAFPDYGACGLFKRLAADYGFVQRYRDDKTKLTGISEEPWHYRYVGYPHSAIMEREGLCLEEYAEFVRREAGQGARLQVETRCARFEIYYVAAEDGVTAIPVPEVSGGASWQLSGNNIDGFVVTLASTGRWVPHG